jgi:hypothetical protein
MTSRNQLQKEIFQKTEKEKWKISVLKYSPGTGFFSDQSKDAKERATPLHRFHPVAVCSLCFLVTE